MLATLVPQPFHRDGWVYEEKVDGWRILACKDGVNRLLHRGEHPGKGALSRANASRGARQGLQLVGDVREDGGQVHWGRLRRARQIDVEAATFLSAWTSICSGRQEV